MSTHLRPKDAATLILVRQAPDGPEILLGQRSSRHAFMPNRYVFPGGRVDPHDHSVPAFSALKPGVLAQLQRAATPARAHALAIAAIRETYEEVGLMLGRKVAADDPLLDKLPARAPWPDFAAAGIVPALDQFDYVARAITPPGRPRRFNARFFMTAADNATGVIRGNGELGDIRWIDLDEAQDLPLPRITHVVLEAVEKRLAHPPRPAGPIPLYRRIHGVDRYMEE